MQNYNNKLTTDINLALRHLRSGEMVAFPTETVYGLGADASSPTAIAKVFAAKGRPADHPLIVHIGSTQELNNWAINIPAQAWVLAEHFWPGPLTLILQKAPHADPLITGGQDSIAIRIPNHRLTLELLKEFGGGLVGPSANKYGKVSPTQAQHVINDLGSEVAAVLDGDACNIGIESTIISLLDAEPVIMRSGQITAAQIAAVLGTPIRTTTAQQKIRVSGSHTSHYAPNTPIKIVANTDLTSEVLKQQGLGVKFSVIAFSGKPAQISSQATWQQLAQNSEQYAQQLYANLRAHDQLNNQLIIIEQVPEAIEWQAIIDRLTRAAF